MDRKLVLAVPNFSEGKDENIINQATDAVRSVETVKIIGVEPEANFNRTVLTFICEPQFYKDAVLRLAKVVYDDVDMQVQKGNHPRIGALDTAPIFPLHNVTIDEIEKLAEDVGQALFETFQVPVYFSGLNARTEYKKSNTNIRKGQYEGLKSLLEDRNHPDYEMRKPDLSVDGRLNARMGAVTVSSDSEGLVAYNVYVESEDLTIAKEIAQMVKSQESGWTSIKSVGFKELSHKGTAVSMNVFDCANTPLTMLRDYIEMEARKRGTKVIATEIVGPVNLRYLVDSAQKYGYVFNGNYDELVECLEINMGLERFKVNSIIEYHIEA